MWYRAAAAKEVVGSIELCRAGRRRRDELAPPSASDRPTATGTAVGLIAAGRSPGPTTRARDR